jgi:hypothetical protein
VEVNYKKMEAMSVLCNTLLSGGIYVFNDLVAMILELIQGEEVITMEY